MSFEAHLARLEAALEVPYPERRELLEELRGHLEDLRDELVAGGASPEDATEEALRTLALDETILASIDEVHAPLVRRALASLPVPLSLVIEHLAVGFAVALALLTVIVKERAMLEFFLSGGVFMIPLNLMGLVILVLAGERLVSLQLKADHSTANLGRRLLSLKYLGWACALVGVLGTLVGFFHAFSVADEVIARHDGIFPIWEVSRIALTTTIWGLTLALVALVVSYVVQAKVARVESMRLA